MFLQILDNQAIKIINSLKGKGVLHRERNSTDVGNTNPTELCQRRVNQINHSAWLREQLTGEIGSLTFVLQQQRICKLFKHSQSPCNAILYLIFDLHMFCSLYFTRA